MTADQVKTITDSWLIVSSQPNLVKSFYDKLFELAPHTKRFFPEDLSKQSEKLAYTLNFLVLNLDRIGEIKESIEDLGRMHNKMQILPEHYGYVKDALIYTILKNMEADAEEKAKVSEAWDLALTFVATTMINAPEKREPRFSRLFARLKKMTKG
ncbi:MAG: globin domain-containing protein [Marinoscillum sp.]